MIVEDGKVHFHSLITLERCPPEKNETLQDKLKYCPLFQCVDIEAEDELDISSDRMLITSISPGLAYFKGSIQVILLQDNFLGHQIRSTKMRCIDWKIPWEIFSKREVSGSIWLIYNET